MFFGESMFSRVPDASKIALCHLARQLVRWEFWLIDCQMSNPHLTSMGAVEVPRTDFITLVERNAEEPSLVGPWALDPVAAREWQRQS
jgi:leucyl/phenylalanyl-tRNA--protein transferase